MTGAELRAKRKAAGLSQVQLAKAAGIGRGTVRYWEAKPALCSNGWACQRIFTALGIRNLPINATLSRTRGDGVLLVQAAMEPLAAEQARVSTETRKAMRRARLQASCGAITRKGQPCRMQPEPNRRRCKFHGDVALGLGHSRAARG